MGVVEKQVKRWWQDKEKLVNTASELKFKIYDVMARLICHTLFVITVLSVLAFCFSFVAMLGVFLGFWQLPSLNDKSCPPCFFCLYCFVKLKFLGS